MRRTWLGALLVALAWAPVLGAEPDGKTWRNAKDRMEMVWVPAGAIEATVRESSGGKEQTATRTVNVAGFWMGRTEVTVKQYARFVRETGYRTRAERVGNRWTWRNPGFTQRGSHPVVFLAEEDAEAYCAWAGTELPTEVEWLYACKAGTATRYHWGETLDGEFAWYRGNTRGLGTRPVGTRRPNSWGLHDMVGNAREYCRAGDGVWVARGSGWARCDSYLTRQGTMAENLVAEGVALELQSPGVPPAYPPYPFDDDRGFRCVRRAQPE